MNMAYDVRVFDAKTEGNVLVSPHFRVREFACKDGSGVVIINMALVSLLETIRTHFNVPITINSAYRTVAHNKSISGSSSESQHCNGNAADIVVRGKTPKEVAEYVSTIMPYAGGIGRYSTFTHVDVRKAKSRWNG